MSEDDFPSIEEQLAEQRAQQEAILAEAEKTIQQELEKLREEAEAEQNKFISEIKKNNEDLPGEDFRQSNEGEENYGPRPELNNRDENIHNDGSLDKPVSPEQVTEPEPYKKVHPPSVPYLPPLSQF